MSSAFDGNPPEIAVRLTPLEPAARALEAFGARGISNALGADVQPLFADIATTTTTAANSPPATT